VRFAIGGELPADLQLIAALRGLDGVLDAIDIGKVGGIHHAAQAAFHFICLLVELKPVHHHLHRLLDGAERELELLESLGDILDQPIESNRNRVLLILGERVERGKLDGARVGPDHLPLNGGADGHQILIGNRTRNAAPRKIGGENNVYHAAVGDNTVGVRSDIAAVVLAGLLRFGVSVAEDSDKCADEYYAQHDTDYFRIPSSYHGGKFG